MTGRFVLLAGLTACLAGLGHAQDEQGYQPLPVGTQIIAPSDGESETTERDRTEIVYANGADFILVGTADALDWGNNNAFFVEFSGVHIVGCDEDMPDAAGRAQLAALWPLAEGKTALAGSDADSAFAFRVTGETELTVRGRESTTVRKVDIFYPGAPEASETGFLAPDLGTMLGVYFEGYGMTQVEAVLRPAPGMERAYDVPASRLGKCASLFEIEDTETMPDEPAED